ncbi:MAG: pilin [Elusimicrobiaceae bacterium]|nr:pilin [Elusimicrobiaceae bacterium]
MKKGFTLIELLVVVLIIGILSAVALPQYQKTVLKSRTAEAWTNLQSLRTAAKVYCLETNETYIDRNALSIEVEDSEYFQYYMSECSNVDSVIVASYKKSPSFSLGFGSSGARSCKGEGCADIGFSTAGSGRGNCFCSGDCYYMN